jgi:hypothetical protein
VGTDTKWARPQTLLITAGTVTVLINFKKVVVSIKKEI